MKPSEQCKAAGLKSLQELCDLTGGQSPQHMINMHRRKPELFEVVVIGAAVKKGKRND